MSWVASGWAKKIVICPDGEKIKRSEKFLLLILSDYHNEELAAAWASVKTLANDALMSKRHCRSLLRKLEKHKLIKTVLGGPGDKGTNSYSFPQLDDGARIAPPVGQPLPHSKRKGWGNLTSGVGKSGIKGGEIASSPKQEETRRNKEEGEGEKPPLPPRDFWKEGGWEKEDRWLFDFLSRQQFLPEARAHLLDNPIWWSSVGVACHGLSVEFLEIEFAKFAAAIEEGTIEKPACRKDWMKRVRRWLIDETRWREDEAKRVEKKRATA